MTLPICSRSVASRRLNSRVSVHGTAIGLARAIPSRQALRAHTIDAAWQVFEEGERGSIEPGKRADLAILSANLLAEGACIRDIVVEETVVRGETAFARQANG